MNKICGYSCEYNKGGICQITYCDKIGNMTTTTQGLEVLTRWQDPTIEEYKKEIQKLKEENNDLRKLYQRTYYVEPIIDYHEEYKKLNNIIEELEKYLIDMFNKTQDIKYCDDLIKLKELKEGK